MKKTLTLLLASTALTAAIGAPAWSAIRVPSDADLRPVAAVCDDARQSMPLVLASDDGDDGDDDDDDDYDDEDDDEDDEDDDNGRSGARNPAPAGTVAPPQNGLFGNGTPPLVKMN